MVLIKDSLTYGLGREDIVFKKISKCINGVKRSKNKYSFFDFYNPTRQILFEMKSLTFPKHMFINAVMNTTKLHYYKHIIFLFEYENDNIFNFENAETHHLYYHIYDHKRLYKTRIIYPDDRIIPVEVIDIPMGELTRFNYDFEYDFDFSDSITEDDKIIFDELINKYG